MPRAPGPPTSLTRVSGPGALVVLVDGNWSPRAVAAGLTALAVVSGDGGRRCRRDTGLAEQPADLALAVSAVAAEGAQRGELAGLGPPGHGLGVDPEKGSDLRRRQQCLGVNGATGHGVLRPQSC